jgi:uncharacterized protein
VNRLSREKSTYLLAHATSPIDWFPWGEEAFAAAKEKDLPIFLSIGYAACHSCHLMTNESFADKSVAKIMNSNFICIKVDREELPAVDSLYMEMGQTLMSDASGWPLNMFLTPDQKPFFATTYLPPNNAEGIMGLSETALYVKDIWDGEDRSELFTHANTVTDFFKGFAFEGGSVFPGVECIDEAASILLENFDTLHGGQQGAPKFPIGTQVPFFLQLYAAREDERLYFYVKRTLDRMQNGGIHDQLGGGFSRYSVDAMWQVPHFEKMLSENAQLAKAYFNAWCVDGDERNLEVAKKTCEYLITELLDDDGGFYASECSDLNGVEGLFYTWTADEIREVLSSDEAREIIAAFGVIEEGNFEGRNVLYKALEEISFDYKPLLKKLYDKREMRDRPVKDDKILTSWNGLAIDAFARIGAGAGIAKYLKIAERCAVFIWKKLYINGNLYHRYCDGDVRFPAVLDDYAFVVRGYITLFEAGIGQIWLDRAMELTDLARGNLKQQNSAFLLSGEAMIAPWIEFVDGSEPSGNGVHAENLLRLEAITGKSHYRDDAEDILRASRESVERTSPLTLNTLIAYDRLLSDKCERVEITGPYNPEPLMRHYHPYRVYVPKGGEGKTIYTRCIDGKCLPPVVDPKSLET